jgi:hypothetical protein
VLTNVVNSVDAKGIAYANTEPSLHRNVQEGVESTKADENRQQVGAQRVIFEAQRHAPIPMEKMCSDLAGNCKRAAEMSVPAICAVT